MRIQMFTFREIHFALLILAIRGMDMLGHDLDFILDLFASMRTAKLIVH